MKKLLVVAAVAACGGGDGDGIAFEALDEALADVFCTKLYACCSDAEAMQFGMILGFTDEATCRTSTQMDLAEQYAEDQTNIDMGLYSYDGGAASTCLDQIANVECALFFADRGVDACDRIFEGNTPNGSACTDDEECQSSYCVIGEMGMGTCMALPGNGQQCAGTCADGLGCISGTCGPLKANGQTCEFSRECESGVCEDTCISETVCDGNDAN
jgi:hypothetical protein